MASSDFPVWGKLPCRHGLQHPAGQHGGNPGFEHSREVCGHHLQTPVDQDEDSPFLAFVPQPAEPASPMRHWKSHWGRGTRARARLARAGGQALCERESLFHFAPGLLPSWIHHQHPLQPEFCFRVQLQVAVRWSRNAARRHMTTFSTASQSVGFTLAMTDCFSLSRCRQPNKTAPDRPTISAIEKVGRPPSPKHHRIPERRVHCFHRRYEPPRIPRP